MISEETRAYYDLKKRNDIRESAKRIRRQWLDTEMEPERFFEILNRCVDEANKGFLKLAG